MDNDRNCCPRLAVGVDTRHSVDAKKKERTRALTIPPANNKLSGCMLGFMGLQGYNTKGLRKCCLGLSPNFLPVISRVLDRLLPGIGRESNNRVGG